MPLLLGIFCSHTMMPLRSNLMSSDVQVPLSMRFALLTKNHSRSDLGVYPHLYLEEVHASLRDMLEAGTI